MNVAQFLDALPFAINIEIVETRRPNMMRCLGSGHFRGCPRSRAFRDLGSGNLRQNPPRKPQFEGLHHSRNTSNLRLRNQQMKMFGHSHIPEHHKPIPPPHPLQNGEKKIASRGRTQHGLPFIATARDEVQIARSVATLKEFRHMTSIDAQSFSKM